MPSEELGKSIEFESFESDTLEEISVPKAEAQEAVAEEIREGK